MKRNSKAASSLAAKHSRLFHALFVEALARGQTLTLRAQSTSMLPTVWPGDIIGVRKECLEPGDIAVVRMPSGELWAHRVVKLTRQQLTLKGDAPRCQPHVVARRQLIGRVVFFRPSPMSFLRRIKHRLGARLLGTRSKLTQPY